MKIGLATDGRADLSRTACLDFVAEIGLQTVEFGLGGWSSAPHVDVDLLLGDARERDRLLGEVRERGLEISALNCSGNPLHPGQTGEDDRALTTKTIELAAAMKIDRVIMMSGLPGAPGDSYPNWITSSWPPEAMEIHEWQWKERVLPYWRELAPFAEGKGIRLCLEQHGRQIVYNTESFFRLRDAVGPVVGVNFDPSHLMWMGGDPVAAIKELGECIYHAHGKDTRIEPRAAVDGLLDTKHVLPIEPRSWNFVSLGHGQSYRSWLRILQTLQDVGYDGAVSIENEDYLLPAHEAIRTSARVLQFCVGQLGRSA